MTSALTIGITGGIGSGKSVVSRVLRCNGFPVYDCDSEAKRIMVRNSNVKDTLKRELGEEIYNYDGQLNRSKLAESLFSDEKIRKFVNGVVHKAVIEDIHKQRKKTVGRFFIESAILASSGIADFCNDIWFVVSPLEIRFERIKKRDDTSIEHIENRIKSQEMEWNLIDKSKILILENDDTHPLLFKILEQTEKINHNLNYTIIC